MAVAPTLLRGDHLASEILDQCRSRAEAFARSTGRPPQLATVLVGGDPASVAYVRMKQNRARRAGVASRDVHLGAGSSTADVVGAVRSLSADDAVDGILVQHPVPSPADERAVFEAIAPHSRTTGLADIVRSADIVVAAVGQANFVRGSWIKPGAIVVDAGYNPGNVGDVAFDEAAPIAGAITPVPGGVGPMTIALLVEQTVRAACQRAGLADSVEAP
jgi:5,10-methylene-tetrahydrofolate dehydrogenase/methenyl tetrahydrofolate cyclohydrolase